MKPLNDWYQKRSQQNPQGIALPRSGTDVFQRTEDLYGRDARAKLAKSIATDCDKLVSQYARQMSQSNDDEAIACCIYDALVSQEARDKLFSAAPSRLLRKAGERQLAESWIRVSHHLSMQDILEKMAASPISWNRIVKHNSPEGADLVDEKPHLQASPAPEPYVSMLSEKKKNKPAKEATNGVSAKMVHDLPKGKYGDHNDMRVMAKPYHKKIESCTRSWCKHPILGWAAMTTRKLFDAGEIGHMCEKIAAHSHEGVPLTVHQFQPKMDEIGQKHDQMRYHEYCFDRDDVMKVATMDFLANNIDRHSGNLMVNDSNGDIDSRGMNSLLAIDHERNFQYHKPLKVHRDIAGEDDVTEEDEDFESETPLDYARFSFGLSPARDNSYFTDHQSYVDWWKKRGPGIRQEFDRQLMSIKDEKVRKHIKKNFDLRADWMDRFAKHIDEHQDRVDHEDALKDLPGVQMERFKRLKPEAMDKVIAKLPKETRSAFDAMSDWLYSSKKLMLTNDDFSTVRDVLSRKLEGASKEDLWDTYLHGITSPKYKKKGWEDYKDSFNPSILVMDHVKKDKALRNYFVKKLEELPEAQRLHSNSDWWLDKFRGIMKGKKEAA